MQPSEPSAEAVRAARQTLAIMEESRGIESSDVDQIDLALWAWALDEFAARQHAALLAEVESLRQRLALVGDGWTGADTPPPVGEADECLQRFSKWLDVLCVNHTGYYIKSENGLRPSAFHLENEAVYKVIAWREQAPHDGGEGES